MTAVERMGKGRGGKGREGRREGGKEGGRGEGRSEGEREGEREGGRERLCRTAGKRKALHESKFPWQLCPKTHQVHSIGQRPFLKQTGSMDQGKPLADTVSHCSCHYILRHSCTVPPLTLG